MIPILFEKGATAFDTNGLGRLPDCISCVVTEERNGMFELAMDYPVNGRRFADITEGRILYCIHDDSKTPQPFDIYSREQAQAGVVTFRARHISYRLNRIPMGAFSASSAAQALAAIPAHSYVPCPFTFWTDKTTEATFTNSVPAAIREKLGGVSGSILDVYGGEYEWDRFEVRLHNHRGRDTAVQIRYGKNLLSLRDTLDAGDLADAVVPYWRDEAEGDVVTAPGTGVVLRDGVTTAETARALDLTDRFETRPEPEQLAARAAKWLRDNTPWKLKRNIRVDFVQLWQTADYRDFAPLQRVNLCDTVSVIVGAAGINVRGVRVIKVEYDVLREQYAAMELGDPSASLADTIRQSTEASILQRVPTKTALEQAVNSATGQITGAKGGHVRGIYDANGKWQELVIMDTEDISTAQKIWRWNLGGLGYSKTGKDGPFGLAITQNGAIVADYITTGTLLASLIKTGVLMAEDNANNYWNMETGEFQIKSTGASVPAIYVSPAGVVEINADDITAGILSALNGQNYWNLETGEFQIRSAGASNPAIAVDQGGNVTINADWINQGMIQASGNASTYWDIDSGVFRIAESSTDYAIEVNSQGGVDINADFVGTGALQSGGNSENYWNMETGEFQIKPKNASDAAIYVAQDGTVMINATYLKAGIIEALHNSDNFWDLENGELQIKGSGATDPAIYADRSGMVMINAAYLKAGILEALNNTDNFWNLATGEFQIKGVHASDPAIYVDGSGNLTINADAINAGSISGNRIQAGTISASAGDSSWNLNTGEFVTSRTGYEGVSIANGVIAFTFNGGAEGTISGANGYLDIGSQSVFIGQAYGANITVESAGIGLRGPITVYDYNDMPQQGYTGNETIGNHTFTITNGVVTDVQQGQSPGFTGSINLSGVTTLFLNNGIITGYQ